MTAIGDTVNIASRLESATKDQGCQVLVSKTAARAGRLPAGVGLACKIALRGRDQKLDAIAIASARDMKEE